MVPEVYYFKLMIWTTMDPGNDWCHTVCFQYPVLPVGCRRMWESTSYTSGVNVERIGVFLRRWRWGKIS